MTLSRQPSNSPSPLKPVPSKTSRIIALGLLSLTLGLLQGSCSKDKTEPATHQAPSASAQAESAQAGDAGSPSQPSPNADAEAPGDAEASAEPADSKFPKAITEGCKDGMVRVKGNYCPGMVQKCAEHHDEYARAKDKSKVSERCLRYEEPSVCVSKERTPLDFCMDRFEYPNQVGELPRVLTSWLQARDLCKEQGKRLCTEDEFNFACEGEEGLPHAWGYNRTDEFCNIDKPYRMPDHTRQMKTYDRCYQDERCKAEMDRLDQRHRIGERLSCVSWSGVVDINGNVNEWVELPGKSYPDRSGLKGGWWGPVRNRCRPTVTFHKEEDYGYEAGFRCCSDLEASAAPAGDTPKDGAPTPAGAEAG